MLPQLEGRLKHAAVLAEGHASVSGVEQAADDVASAILLAVRIELACVALLASASVAKACSVSPVMSGNVRVVMYVSGMMM